MRGCVQCVCRVVQVWGKIFGLFFFFCGCVNRSSCLSSHCFLQACGVGGMRKRQEPPAIEDRDKPYVCDSEHLRSSFSLQCLFVMIIKQIFLCVCHSLWKALQEPPRAELPLYPHTPGRRGRGGRLWATHATISTQEQPQAWVFGLKTARHCPFFGVLARWAGWSWIYRYWTVTLVHFTVIPTIHYN